MVTVGEVSGVITEVNGIAQAAATITEGLDPGVAMPVEAAAALAALLTQLIAVGANALTMAQGVAITPASIAAALSPDPTPLSDPTA